MPIFYMLTFIFFLSPLGIYGISKVPPKDNAKKLYIARTFVSKLVFDILAVSVFFFIWFLSDDKITFMINSAKFLVLYVIVALLSYFILLNRIKNNEINVETYNVDRNEKDINYENKEITPKSKRIKYETSNLIIAVILLLMSFPLLSLFITLVKQTEKLYPIDEFILSFKIMIIPIIEFFLLCIAYFKRISVCYLLSGILYIFTSICYIYFVLTIGPFALIFIIVSIVIGAKNIELYFKIKKSSMIKIKILT